MSKRVKTPVIEAPTREQAEEIMTALGICLAQKQAAVALANECKLEIDRSLAAKIEPLDKDILAMQDCLHAWAKENKQEFDEKRTVEFQSGKLGYRLGNPTLKPLPHWTWADILQTLVESDIKSCIRIKHEVDKEYIISNRDAFSQEWLASYHMRISQSESFFVEPRLDSPDTKSTSTEEVE